MVLWANATLFSLLFLNLMIFSESDRELEDEDEQSGETRATITKKSDNNNLKPSKVEECLICYEVSRKMRDHLGKYHNMGSQSIQNIKDKVIYHTSTLGIIKINHIHL